MRTENYKLNLVKFSKEKAECIKTLGSLLNVIYWRIKLGKAKQKGKAKQCKTLFPSIDASV